MSDKLITLDLLKKFGGTCKTSFQEAPITVSGDSNIIQLQFNVSINGFYLTCLDIKGIGEKITPIKLKNDWYVLIVMPEMGLSTKDVFVKADEMELKHGNIENVINALHNGNEEELGKAMFNSLQDVSISMNPEIQPNIDLMKNDGLSAVMMSGSGSSVFAISKNRSKLQKIYLKYEKMGLDVYLTKVIKDHE